MDIKQWHNRDIMVHFLAKNVKNFFGMKNNAEYTQMMT